MRVAIFIIIFLLCSISFASDYPAESDTIDVYEETVSSISSAIISSANEFDKTILKSVKIKVSDENNSKILGSRLETSSEYKKSVYSRRDNSGSYIFVPKKFLDDYSRFCIYQTISYAVTGEAESAVLYSHFLYERDYFNDKEGLNITLTDFLNISPNDPRVIFEGNSSYYNACLNAGVSFLIAHEYGHHVLSKFYNNKLSKDELRKMEVTVDLWAMDALERVGIPPLGFIFIAVYERSNANQWFDFSKSSESETHPSVNHRVKNSICSEQGREVLNNFFDDNTSDSIHIDGKKKIENFCAGIEKELLLFDPNYHERLALEGNIDAYYNLGNMYSKGFYDVKENIELSFINFEKAAHRGHVLAQLNLGNNYALGVGVEKNLAKALIWYDFAQYQHDRMSTRNINSVMNRINKRNEGSNKDIEIYKCVTSKINTVLDAFYERSKIDCNKWCMQQKPGTTTKCMRGQCTHQAVTAEQFHRLFSMDAKIYDTTYTECSGHL